VEHIGCSRLSDEAGRDGNKADNVKAYHEAGVAFTRNCALTSTLRATKILPLFEGLAAPYFRETEAL
jgi:hypothetical protein